MTANHDLTYQNIIREVLEDGVEKPLARGSISPTISKNGIFYSVDLANGFPLLTTKRMSFWNIVAENVWFLRGDQDIKWLHRMGVRFWDPWANDQHEIPSAYGALWRGGDGEPDQVKAAMDELRRNPYSRRAVVAAWIPRDALVSILPPCHMIWALNFDGRLNLHLFQRSCDVGIGLPYNLAGYALLLHLFAIWLDMPVGKFTHSIVDAHIYTSHVDQLREQLIRVPNPPPQIKINSGVVDSLDRLVQISTWAGAKAHLQAAIKLEGYRSHEAINLPVEVY